MSGVNFFGIRHLSPAGAFFLREFLDKTHPELVIIEAPRDFEDMAADIVRAETRPPFALLAYTKSVPVRTLLYPFAEYSPEYQAIRWCHENGIPFRFMDLPSETFLALSDERQRKAEEGEGEGSDENTDGQKPDVYELLAEKSADGSHETFWERTLEQCADAEAYREGANLFGGNIRELSDKDRYDEEETALRESYMRHVIRSEAEGGVPPERIVVVTGAYHVEGLKTWENKEKLPRLPVLPSLHTLMPYSYYRLSTRSGYGAGNKAPAYYELIWNGLQKGDRLYAANAYLTKIAEKMRETGYAASSAQVIEALRLGESLAKMRGGLLPTLRDLRDAAQTCIGEGNFAVISTAAADTEIGTKIGEIPEGVSRTSIQDDFYRQMKELKLERYRTLTAQDLRLDLRENIRASSERSAFLDRNRSFFLHRLRVLGLGFAEHVPSTQENATWAESWILRWDPESEITLVESALKGDTVEIAAAVSMKEIVERAQNMSDIAKVIDDSFLCGMSSSAGYAISRLQAAAADEVPFEELAKTAFRLSGVISYGDIRKVDNSAVEPVLKQLYYRACLVMNTACICNDDASKEMAEAILMINSVELAQSCLETETWIKALREVSSRDDLNTRLSGLCTAILLERNKMTNDELRREVSRRLSKGVPADLGAGWFEGLALRNRRGLIARLSLWESVDEFISSLDDEEFKRALVFLRRAFADFASGEKDAVAENLGEIWGLNGAEVSEAVNAPLDDASQQILEELSGFDFDL